MRKILPFLPMEALADPALCPEFDPTFVTQSHDVWGNWCRLMRKHAGQYLPEAALLYRNPSLPGALWPILYFNHQWPEQGAQWGYQFTSAIHETSSGCLPVKASQFADLMAALVEDLGLAYQLNNMMFADGYVEDDRALWWPRLGADLSQGYDHYVARLSSSSRYDVITRPGRLGFSFMPMHQTDWTMDQWASFAVAQCEHHWEPHLERQFAIWQALFAIAACTHPAAQCLVAYQGGAPQGFAMSLHECNPEGVRNLELLTTCCTTRANRVGVALIQALIRGAVARGRQWFDLSLLDVPGEPGYARYIRPHATDHLMVPRYASFCMGEGTIEAQIDPPYYKAGAWHT